MLCKNVERYYRTHLLAMVLSLEPGLEGAEAETAATLAPGP